MAEPKPEKKGLPLLEDLANQLEHASSNSDYTKIISILEILKESDIGMNPHMMKKTNIGSIVKNLKKNHVLNKQIASLSDEVMLKWKLNIFDKLPETKDIDKKDEKEQKKQKLTAAEKTEVSKAAIANLTKIRLTDKFVLFYHGCFSQFYKANMIINNEQFFCCEQYMMAEKAKLFKDEAILKEIMTEKNDQMKVKKLGRKVNNFDETEWNKHKETIVYNGNYAKFTQNQDLKDELLKYGKRTFVEASPSDKIWGIGLAMNDKKCDDENTWNGLNLLGIAITKVRDEILKQQQNDNNNTNDDNDDNDSKTDTK